MFHLQVCYISSDIAVWHGRHKNVTQSNALLRVQFRLVSYSYFELSRCSFVCFCLLHCNNACDEISLPLLACELYLKFYCVIRWSCKANYFTARNRFKGWRIDSNVTSAQSVLYSISAFTVPFQDSSLHMVHWTHPWHNKHISVWEL